MRSSSAGAWEPHACSRHPQAGLHLHLRTHARAGSLGTQAAAALAWERLRPAQDCDGQPPPSARAVAVPAVAARCVAGSGGGRVAAAEACYYRARGV